MSPFAVGRTPRRAVAALVAVVAVLGLSACNDSEGTGDKGYISADGLPRPIDPADRKEPVELAGEDLDGNPLDVADHRGKVTVLNVWEAWCPPCRAETPDLVAAAAETAELADFVGINTEDNVGAAQAFERSQEIPYPSLASPDGKARLAFQGQVPAGALPSTLVLDKEGRIAVVFNGTIPSKLTLVQVIEDIAEFGEMRDASGAGSEGS